MVTAIVLLALQLAPFMAAAANKVPTVEIAPNVMLPMINDGVSNRSVWIGLGGTGLDTALSCKCRYCLDLSMLLFVWTAAPLTKISILQTATRIRPRWVPQSRAAASPGRTSL
eukprot:SAG11_NODE_185_length_13160_cov_9.118521_2_plen_113_part_00